MKRSHFFNIKNVFFMNQGGKLQNRAEESGADLALNSRSVIQLDFDQDGDRDLFLNNYQSPAVLFENHAEKRNHHWIKLKLIGNPERGSNRDAIGARVIARTPNGNSVWREIHGAGSYLPMNPKTVHLTVGIP